MSHTLSASASAMSPTTNLGSNEVSRWQGGPATQSADTATVIKDVQYQIKFIEVPIKGAKNTTVMVPELEMMPVLPSKEDDTSDATPRAANDDVDATPFPSPSHTTTESTSASTPTATATAPPSAVSAATQLQKIDDTPKPPSSSSSSMSSAATPSATSGLIQSEGSGMYRIGGANGPTLSTGAMIGICVGAGVIVLVVAALLIWCCCRCCSRRRRRRDDGQRRLKLESAAVGPSLEKKTSVRSLLSRGSRSKKSRKGSIASFHSGSTSQLSSLHTIDDRDTLGRSSKESMREGEADPTMTTFASYYHSGGAQALPSNYHTMPMQHQRGPSDAVPHSLPYYRNGRLSTGLGLTPTQGETLTVPPLPPAAPAPAQLAPTRRAKVLSPPAASIIHFGSDDDGDGLAPLQTKRTTAARHNSGRDTMASVYSMESAQENHDYGEGAGRLPAMPAVRRYI